MLTLFINLKSYTIYKVTCFLSHSITFYNIAVGSRINTHTTCLVKVPINALFLAVKANHVKKSYISIHRKVSSIYIFLFKIYWTNSKICIIIWISYAPWTLFPNDVVSVLAVAKKLQIKKNVQDACCTQRKYQMLRKNIKGKEM